MRFLIVFFFFIIIVTACNPLHDNIEPATTQPTATTKSILLASPTRRLTPTPIPTLTTRPTATQTKIPVLSPTIKLSPTATPAIITGNFDPLSALKLMHINLDVVYSDNLGEQTHGLVTIENVERNIGIQSGGRIPCDILASQLDEPPFPCISIVLMESFVKDNINQVLLVTQIALSDCHFCPPNVYGSIFQETPTGWTMRLNGIIPVHGGSYGHSPQVEFTQMGIEQFALVFHPTDLTLGHYSGADILFIEDETEWRNILGVQTSRGHYGNEGDGVWGFRSEAEFVTGENAPYFDYLVITSGTKDFFTEDGVPELRPFTEERRYIFKNGEYVLEE